MAGVLLLDPSLAGISGNMLIGCLLDLGADRASLDALLQTVSEDARQPVGLEAKGVRRAGLRAQWADWSLPTTEGERSGSEFLALLKETSSGLTLTDQAREVALRTGAILVQSEGKVHGRDPDTTLFHELGSLDTLLDLLGTVTLLDDLDLLDGKTQIVSTPVAVGRGSVESRHGRLPVPPPVTAEILTAYSIPFHMTPVDGEFATPTGVALLAALVDSFDPTFTMRAEAIGYGAGGREVAGLPNVLRAMMGKTGPPGEEVISVLETNLDDVTGEVLGYLAQRLMEAGVLDFHLVPTVTKKNRPGHLLQVFSPPGMEDRIVGLIQRETGTLGVRVNYTQRRIVLEREMKTLEVPALEGAKIRFKVARDAHGEVLNVKPEYEDVREAAESLGIPLRDAIQQAEEVGRQLRRKG
ncbi:MAG: nickel pincer cofactor biosynthesis protein LarC [Thermoplasmata archaeon]